MYKNSKKTVQFDGEHLEYTSISADLSRHLKSPKLPDNEELSI